MSCSGENNFGRVSMIINHKINFTEWDSQNVAIKFSASDCNDTKDPVLGMERKSEFPLDVGYLYHPMAVPEP